jgi:hypothetical protein
MDLLKKWRERSQLRRSSRHVAAVRYLMAHEALWRNSADEHDAGIDYETPEYLRLNRAAYDAAEGISRWRQAVLDRRLLRKLRLEGFGWCNCGGALIGPGRVSELCACRRVGPLGAR